MATFLLNRSNRKIQYYESVKEAANFYEDKSYWIVLPHILS